MENYTITIPATSQPVTLAEAKTFMKVTHSVEDSLITALIIAATQAIENYTGQYFVERTVKGEFSNLFISKTELYPYVKLRRAPLKSVTSVLVSVDSSLDSESYQAKKPSHGFARILLDDFDSFLDDIPYPLEILFVAGYTSSGTITKFEVNASVTTVTSVNHGLSANTSTTISGTTSYNGTYFITNVTTDTFDIAKTFVSDDATGTWLSGVPENIKLAIMENVNFLYRNRGDCVDSSCSVLASTSGFPPITKALITPYKIIEVYA